MLAEKYIHFKEDFGWLNYFNENSLGTEKPMSKFNADTYH